MGHLEHDVERAGAQVTPLAMNTLKCGIALLILWLILLVVFGHGLPAVPNRRAVYLLLASGVIGLAIGDTLFFEALMRLGAREALLLLMLTVPMIVVATLIGTVAGVWLLIIAITRSYSTGVAATLLALTPVFVLPLVAIVDRERLTARAVVGALVAFAGVAALFLAQP